LPAVDPQGLAARISPKAARKKGGAIFARFLVMPTHHPDDSLLLEYAAGSLDEAKALLVATHLALCPACRNAVRSGEAASAALAFAGDVTETISSLVPDVSGEAVEAPPARHAASSGLSLPQPLRGYLGASVTSLPWSSVGLGLREYRLPEFKSSTAVRLLAIPAGRRMPRHTHEGEELTLVLQGSFSDVTGDYQRGDVATADSTLDHQPRAGEGEECLCLAVEEAPLRFTGVTGTVLTAVARARNLFGR
jgi:putative transcriptional regulator